MNRVRPPSAREQFPLPPEQFEKRDRRPAYKRIGTYLPILLVLGMAMAMLSYVAAMQVLGYKMPTLGGGLFAGAGQTREIATVPKDLYLYASPTTRAYFAGIGGNYDRLLSPWRDYFTNRRESVKELTDATQLSAVKQGILILPSAVALTPQERTEILRFRAEGGAVLATWAVGTRNPTGGWEGWKFLEVLGAKSLGEIAPEPVARHLILNGESPVSHSQPSGQRIWLGNASERVLRFKGENSAARVMNWSRIPDTERRDEGAVMFSETSPTAGRTALFAFAESGWETQPQPIYSLVDDTLNWLQRAPAIVRAAWPSGKRAAQVIEMDTEEGFINAPRFAAMMQAIGRRYVGCFNARYGRTGTLWESRFKSALVDSERMSSRATATSNSIRYAPPWSPHPVTTAGAAMPATRTVPTNRASRRIEPTSNSVQMTLPAKGLIANCLSTT